MFCRETPFKKMVICLCYPSDYPSSHIFVELKSKTLSEKLLDGLVRVAEAEAKKYLGKPHALFVIKFIRQFVTDNPLCCCSGEIADVKKMLSDHEGDKMKLSQKNSAVNFHIVKDRYFLKGKIKVF